MTSTEKELFQTNFYEKVCIFNKSVLNVLSNFIPHETILCDDKDPSWFNSRIKSLLQAKNKVFKKGKTNTQLLDKLNFLQERLNSLGIESKNNYYDPMANKPNNLQRNSKPYWSLLKWFLNNNKIPLIPPLFHKDKLFQNGIPK